mgnify:FL=1
MKFLLRAVLWIYLSYLAISILVVTPALNFLAPWAAQKYLGRELQTEIILFNPFTLSLEVKQAEVPEHDGRRFFGLGRGLVDLSVESLWRPGVVFDAIDIEHLFVHLRRLTADTYNFSDLLPAAGGEEPPPEAESAEDGLPPITIHDLDFHADRIQVTDEARDKPFTTHWDGLAFHVDELSTAVEEGRPSRLSLRDEAGGTLDWEGDISIAGAHSRGRVAISDLSLAPGWRFIEPWVAFRLMDGRLNLNGAYDLGWKDSLSYRVNDGAVEIENLDLEPVDSGALPDTRIRLHSLLASGIAIDGEAQHAKVESVLVDNPEIRGWSEGARVSLIEKFAVDFGGGDDADQESGTEKPWTAEIAGIRLREGRVHWRSEFTDPPVLWVTPIRASVDNLRWPFEGESPLSLALAINEQASLNLEGSLALASGDGLIRYQLDGLPLPWFNPNLPAALKADITGGAAHVGGDVALAGFVPTVVQSTGDIDDFSGKIRDVETNLTSWDRVRWEGVAVDLPGRSVLVDRLYIKNFAGRLHIYEDGTINSQRAWQQELAGADGETIDDTAGDATGEAGTPESPWRVDLPAIFVTDSQLDFMDESLPIKFRTVIGDLNGDVLGLSSVPDSRAQVNLKGAVDGYAPVVLAGTAAPLSEPPAVDLKLTFDGVDMALLTPYSGTYAGRTIERGILNLDLQYSLENNHLEGSNEILIDKMKLGERVESDRAIDLPLDLAVALLTDLNGIIDLSVPVSGDVDNPEFSIGSVVFSALVNLITKAVTAPFNLLASLVNSEEDLQRVNFDAGSAGLKDGAKEKLGDLAAALTQRPALTLLVAGRFNPAADRAALQQRLLDEQLLAAGLSAEELEEKGAGWEEAVAALYATSFPQQEGTPEVDPPAPPQQYRKLVEQAEVTEAQLVALTNERAIAVKQYLVNEAQIAADRAVIEQVTATDEANTFSGVELSLDT